MLKRALKFTDSVFPNFLQRQQANWKFSPDDIQMLLGGNLLRVMKQVETVRLENVSTAPHLHPKPLRLEREEGIHLGSNSAKGDIDDVITALQIRDQIQNPSLFPPQSRGSSSSQYPYANRGSIQNGSNNSNSTPVKPGPSEAYLSERAFEPYLKVLSNSNLEDGESAVDCVVLACRRFFRDFGMGSPYTNS